MTSPKPNTKSEVLSLTDAAARLGFAPGAAYRIVALRRWPTPIIEINGRYKVPIQAVDDLLKNGNLPQVGRTAGRSGP